MIVLVLFGLFFGLDTAKKPERFISIGGLFVNILFCWIFSKHRTKVEHVFLCWYSLVHISLHVQCTCKNI